jgi:hypothetical protein
MNPWIENKYDMVWYAMTVPISIAQTPVYGLFWNTIKDDKDCKGRPQAE